MAARKKKVEVEVEVTEETEKPILVTETESSPEQPEPQTPLDPPASDSNQAPEPVKETSQIFGPLPADPPKSNKKLFWIIIIVFTLLGGLAGGIGIYLQNSGETITPTPSPAATATPTPTPEVELDKSELSVQILNGSGISGAAAKAQEYLEGLDYVVDAVGNADTSDYTTTQIAIKADKKAYTDLLVKDLSAQYSVDEEIGELDEDSDYDVVITLGKE